MSLLAMWGGVALRRLLLRQHRARAGLTPRIHRLYGHHICEGVLDSTHALASTLFEWLFTPRLQPQILLIISATFIVAMLPLLGGIWLTPSVATPVQASFIALWIAGGACAVGAARLANYPRLASLRLAGGGGPAPSLPVPWLA